MQKVFERSNNIFLIFAMQYGNLWKMKKLKMASTILNNVIMFGISLTCNIKYFLGSWKYFKMIIFQIKENNDIKMCE